MLTVLITYWSLKNHPIYIVWVKVDRNFPNVIYRLELFRRKTLNATAIEPKATKNSKSKSKL